LNEGGAHLLAADLPTVFFAGLKDSKATSVKDQN